MSDYSEKRAKDLQLMTREVLKSLPQVCTEFVHAIMDTTQPLTRYAYVCDLKIFCEFLVMEIPAFADKQPTHLTCADFESVTARNLHSYLEYLGYYIKDDEERSNSDAGKLRKFSTLRSFYEFMFKNEYIHSDTTKLVDMPRRREKPIIRMEIDEVARMLDSVENGDVFDEHQRRYNDNTRTRDLAILTLFLGTGIRVSELVGLDLDDVDFTLNSFLITRKGGNQSILYFSDEVAEVLRAYIDQRVKMTSLPGHEQALFLSLQNKRISVRSVQVMVKKYALPAAPLKKKLSPHKLRSTFGTNLYHETGDIYLVADVLGHSDVNTTRRHYAAMSDERRRMAAKKVILRETPQNEDITPGDV